ncbi:MAG: 2Fe-2S iron-sulfur cluster-binding protein [Steroidobacteraceae bacterium]
MRRLPPLSGEWIDRKQPLAFTFEGQSFSGYAGDTLSSALAANGQKIIGRSFKYHRPRGLLSVANHDSNAIMQVQHLGRVIPNVRADVTPLEDGMRVTAVNTRGGLARDSLQLLDSLSGFLPVGFYYKAFHSKRFFPKWERLFRNLTGLSKLDLNSSRRRTPKRYAFADVLVIGAGPSGLAAALSAADSGAEVMLVDENAWPGGSGLYARGGQDADARQTLQLMERVRKHTRIQLLCSTYAAGYYADHWVALVTPTEMVKVRARALIIAQGAFEQPAVFRNNDLPGIMLASGAQRLLHRYAVAPCDRVLILTANPQGYAAALDALERGIDVAAVIDLRTSPGPASSQLAERLDARGIPVRTGATIGSASAGRDGCLRSVVVNTRVQDEVASVTGESVQVDGVWMSVGFAPAHSLLLQAGARLQFETALGQYVPSSLPAGVFACGKVTGVYGFTSRLTDGTRVGEQAAAYVQRRAPKLRSTASTLGLTEMPSHPYPIASHAKGKNFVDFDEDLQLKDFANAVQEGFDSIELLKRYTTVGMGPSQGKHSNLNAMRILSKLRGEPVERIGATTARPMFHPVPLSHLAGRSFSPERATPLAKAHEALGAVWMLAGQWKRPEYYAVAGLARAQAIEGEVRAVRTGAGLIDVGTLGKIEIHGPDAAEFLDRVYAGRYGTLKVGMTRYGLMLDESGVIIDDGVIGRLADESFYFTTTTGNSASIYRELGRLATQWNMKIGLVNATGHYAAFNLAGPLSRRILTRLTNIDLAQASFPFLGLREGTVAGVPARLMRVGFVGELGYEIHVPADSALHVWDALLAAGSSEAVRPFGVEAQRVLRLEKGHLIVGQDTDGLTDPLQAGCEWAIKMDKPFFIGQRSLKVLEKKPKRQQLVGFQLVAPGATLPKEGHLVLSGGEMAGRVTSVTRSPTLNAVIGLAMVTPAVAASTAFRIRIDGGREVDATITPLPFYDAAGTRQKMVEAP